MQPDLNAAKPGDDPNHPMHKMSARDQEKMRKEENNLVLEAEIDDVVYKREGKGTWTNFGNRFRWWLDSLMVEIYSIKKSSSREHWNLRRELSSRLGTDSTNSYSR